MKITETKVITRNCCQDGDLKRVEGCRMWNYNVPDLKFCVHCGGRWEHTQFMDAAGSTDWEYRKVAESFDPKA